MPWKAPTAADVLSEFTPNEVAAITTLMGGSPFDPNSKLSVIVQRTVDEIRGYIRSGAYPVDETSVTTLPDALIPDCISMARWRFLISAPQLKQLQTQERYQDLMDSLKKIQAIGQHQFNVEPPTSSTVDRAGNWNSENKILMRTHPIPGPSKQFQFDPNQPPYANPNAPADAP
jgi:hypothetical protein